MTEQWQELKETITEMRDNDGTGTQQETCKFLVDYMEVLEKQMQQPCEDCISRESVRQKLQENYDFFVNAYGGFGNLPQSDKPRVDEIDNCIAMIVNEPPVYPERPKGKWIEIEIDAGEFIYKCSKCGMRVINPYKYCPNCGAEMGGADETN